MGRVGATAAMAAVLALGACQSMKAPQAQPAGSSGAIDAQVHEALTMLNRGHTQKMELAFYATTPLLRNIHPEAKAFFSRLSDVHGDLQRQLKKWAAKHKVDLTFRRGDDFAARAQKVMEDRQEKVIRSDSNADFQRDILMNMQIDHDWESSLISVILPMVQDGELRSYLQNSLRAHESAAREIRGLLEKYKFVP